MMESKVDSNDSDNSQINSSKDDHNENTIDHHSDTTPLMMEYENVARNDGIGLNDVRNFFKGFIVSQVIGLFAIVFVSVWICKYLGGIGWTSVDLIFNYHPLFMILGMIFVYGDAILVYRVLRNERKKILKLLHAGLNGTAFLFAMFALWAVLHFHNSKGIPNYYSLHSWVGGLTLTFFAIQFLMGFMSFLFPGIAPSYRKMIMPYHVFFGLTIFTMACGTALMGITEKAFFSLNGKGETPKYSDLPTAGVVLNLLGISVLLFGITVVYLVSKPQFVRRPLPEEQMLQMQLSETSPVN